MAVVRDAAAGLRAADRGATLLQLRDPTATARALEREACRLVAEAAVPVVVSARADLALAVGAAGVHLPERDLPVAGARRLLGPDRLLGRSVHSVEAAVRAEAEGADYVVFGSVFASASHPGQEVAGLAALERVAAGVRIPVLAIGGGGSRVRRHPILRGMIGVQVNGKAVELAGPTPLLDYLRGLGVDARAVAVEVNGEILERERYGACTLDDGDTIEIVRMVGGGTCRRRPGSR